MKVLRILLCIAAGWLLNMLAHTLVDKPAPVESPLKVTIIDDGGADLKVESTVK